MNAALGTIGIWIAFLASLGGAIGLTVSIVRQTKGADAALTSAMPGPFVAHDKGGKLGLRGTQVVPFVLAGAVVATLAMEHALVSHDFTIVYVAENNSKVTPTLYSITGMWSALEGSILLWATLLALVTTAVVVRYRRQASDAVVGWATVVLLVVCAFFFGLMTGPANPFVTQQATSGLGPNALLQNNPLVAIHPPLLYFGFVGFTVPFAFAIAMLITGRVGERWLISTRRWTLVSWTALSVGIVLGAWWSYQVLGWGGFWAWDPVENAALMPWLIGTAYLHSILVQERRGLLRVWNLSLSIIAFALTILGTFLTRSGVIQSVHSFSESTLGPLLIGAFIATIVVGFGLLAWRGDRLRSPGGIDAPLGREGAFVLNNVLFVGFCFVVLLGTVYPLFYEALTHQQVTVGGPYFTAVAIPVSVALLFLMAVAPALSWRKVTPLVLWKRLRVPAWIAAVVLVVLVLAGVRGLPLLLAVTLAIFAASSALRSLVLSVRTSRRHGNGVVAGLLGRSAGGMIVHLGVVVLAVGVAASTSSAKRTELALAPGAVVSFDGHTFSFVGTTTIATAVKRGSAVKIQVDGGATFAPAITTFQGRNSEPVGTPAIDSGFRGDIYLTFDAVGGQGNVSGASVIPNLPAGSIAIGVVVEPLLPWIWAGGLIVGVGGLSALVPDSWIRRRRATTPSVDAAREPVPSEPVGT